MFIFLDDGEGLKKDTLQKRKQQVQLFDAYIRRHFGVKFSEVIHEVTELEKMLVSYFDNMKVTQRDGAV